MRNIENYKNWEKKYKKRRRELWRLSYKKKLLPPLERFWTFVKKGNNENSCWEWQGVILKGGYGKLGRKYAHRYSYEIHKGKIPKGYCVCHECDNPRCVNPNHLWIGTRYDNNHDRDIKGRGRYSHKK